MTAEYEYIFDFDELDRLYRRICSDFIQNYSKTPNNFEALIQKAFGDANEDINDVFKKILAVKEWSNDEIGYMIECGVNLKTINDIGEVLTDIFIDHTDTLRILLDRGLELTENDIHHLVRRIKYISLLIEKGIDIKKILEQISFYHEGRSHLEPGIYDFVINQLKSISSLHSYTLNNLCMLFLRAGKLTVNILQIFVDAGLNSGSNDECFLESCKSSDITIAQYFIVNCGANVNFRDGHALFYAINLNNLPLMELLLDSDIIVSDRHIEQAIRDEKFVEMMLRHGISHERIAKIFVESFMGTTNQNIFRLLMSDGSIDFNQYINSAIAKID